jgi:hypothetical protein
VALSGSDQDAIELRPAERRKKTLEQAKKNTREGKNASVSKKTAKNAKTAIKHKSICRPQKMFLPVPLAFREHKAVAYVLQCNNDDDNGNS